MQTAMGLAMVMRQEACDAPTGFVPMVETAADGHLVQFPGGIDNDCNDAVDDDLTAGYRCRQSDDVLHRCRW